MRLLLAEDERELSKALVSILKHNNFTVDAVYDGEAALEFLSAEVYDGVILDIMMPKKDGITVLKEVRASGNAVPILLLTAKAEIDDKVLGLDSGANDYLTKPFATAELLARIRSMTRRQGMAQDNRLRYGNIVLDRATYELSANENSTRLSNKEFQMMEMLMSSPKVAISVDRFMDKIWGWESDAEINVVWVYISALRKKLKAIGANTVITANRNVGYSLVIAEE